MLSGPILTRRELLALLAAHAAAGAARREERPPAQPPPRAPVTARECNLSAHAVTIQIVRAGRPVDDARLEVYERRGGRVVRRVDRAALGDGRYVLFTDEDRPDAALPSDAYGLHVSWQGRERRVVLRFADPARSPCHGPRLEGPLVVELD